MALKPVADRVIVKYFETEDKTASGIVLPDSSKEKIQVKPGDRVIYGKYTGTEIKYEGEKYLVINADDIIAIVKD